MSKKKQKKKAHITNRQAKIRQKKKKPSKQTSTKYKRLQQKVKNGFRQQGISTEGIEFVESSDGVKMSEVILKLADPMLKEFGDDDKQINCEKTKEIFSESEKTYPRL